jgi:hypothetical protein
MEILRKFSNILLVDFLVLLDKCLNTSDLGKVAWVILLNLLLLGPWTKLNARLKLIFLISVPCPMGTRCPWLPFTSEHLFIHVDVSLQRFHIISGMLVNCIKLFQRRALVFPFIRPTLNRFSTRWWLYIVIIDKAWLRATVMGVITTGRLHLVCWF